MEAALAESPAHNRIRGHLEDEISILCHEHTVLPNPVGLYHDIRHNRQHDMFRRGRIVRRRFHHTIGEAG